MTKYYAMYGIDREAARELLVVDPGVKDVEILLDELSPAVEIVYLNKCQNPLFQIAQALASHTRIETVHILAHGSPGMLHLGGVEVDEAYLHTQEGMLAAIEALLADDASIALWACSVAWTTQGESFIRALEAGTGAEVYATDRPVGAASLGGDWNIGVRAPFTEAAQSSYPHTLPTFDMDIGQTGAPFHTTFSDQASGVTMTITGSGLRSGHYSEAGLTDGYVLGNLSAGPSLTVSFDAPINISSFVFAEYGGAQGGTYSFTVTDGTGSAFYVTSASIPVNGSVPNAQYEPSDWTSVSSFTITSSNGNFQSVIDTINFTVPNDAPEFDDADDTVTLVVDEDAEATAIPGLAVTDINAGNTLTWTEGTAPNKGSVSISGTATASGSSGDVPTSATYTPSENQTGSDSFTVQVSDGNGGTDTLTVNVTINAVDDTPTFTATGADTTFTEAGSAASLFSGVTANVVDSGQTFTGFELVVSGVTEGSDEQLNIDGGTVQLELGSETINGITYTVSADGDDLAVTATGATLNDADFADLIEGISYQNDSSAPTEADRTFALSSVTDSGSSNNTATPDISATIEVVGNDVPTVSTTSINPGFAIGGDSVDLFSNVSASTNDVGQTFSTLTIIVNNLEDGADEVLHISGVEVPLVTGNVSVNGQNFSVSLNSTQAVVQATGADYSSIELANLIDSLQYENTSVTATEGSRRVILHSANDSGASDNSVNLQHVSTVTVAPPNEAPTISLPSAPVVAEDSADIEIDAITLADDDGDDQTVTLTVTGGTVSLDGTDLDFTVGDGNDDAAMTFSGTLSEVNTALDSLTFTPTENLSGASAGSIRIQTADALGANDDETLTFDIAAENDAPTLSGLPDDLSFTEDTEGNIDLSDVTVADIDGDDVTVTVTVSGGTITSLADGQSIGAGVEETALAPSVITLEGSVEDINTYLSTASNIRYTGAENVEGDNVATLTISVSDNDTSSSDTANIDISANNDAPTASDIPTEVSGNEDSAISLDLGDVVLADVDDTELTLTLTASSGTITAGGDRGITIEDNDTAAVTISGTISALNTYLATDTVTFTGDEDENGDDYATVTIEADDGAGQTTLGTITVDVDAVNDAPTVEGVPEGITVAEDTATHLSLSDISVADVDGDTLTLTLTANEGSFSSPATMSGVTATLVDAQTITLNGSASDINSYLDQANAIEYTGAENENGVNADRITFSVSDATLSADGIALLTITAVDDAAVVSGTTTGSVTEGNEGDRAATATGTLSISDADPADSPSFADQAATAGDNDYGSFELTDGTWTYTLDQSAVQDLDAGDTVTDTITFAASDDTEQQITITITGTADDAVITGTFTGTLSERIGSSGTATGTLSISDVDADDAPSFADQAATVGDNGYGTFELSDGTWTYTLDRSKVAGWGAGHSVTDSITYTASDDSTQQITVTIAGENDAPSSPKLASTGVDEDEKGAFVGTLSSIDPEGDSVSFSVEDARFKVVGDKLYLADDVSLSYEDIQELSIKVTASDGGKGSAAFLDVTVNDLPEAIVNTPTDGNDTVMGGDGRDTLTGGAGNDTLDGGAGDDTIIKDNNDDGQDIIVGGEGNDMVRSGGGNDFIVGDGASDGTTRQSLTQNGDTSTDGADTLRGGTGDDTILGGGWDDDLVNDNGSYDDGEEVESGTAQNRIWAGDGNDVAVGSGGDDAIGGSTGNDKLNGLGGNDTLFGNIGDDLVLGGAGDDLAFNGTGTDTVDGGAGDDTLWASAGDDQLTGGAGADTFCFGALSGNDVVTDFNLDEDTLHLSYRGFVSLDQVLSRASETSVNEAGGVMIDLGDGESAFLIGLTLEELSTAQITL